MRYSTTDPVHASQIVVRGSTFVENEPYGLPSFEYRGGADAILNCWGHPTAHGCYHPPRGKNHQPWRHRQ